MQKGWAGENGVALLAEVTNEIKQMDALCRKSSVAR
jgi:hypothetical protein